MLEKIFYNRDRILTSNYTQLLHEFQWRAVISIHQTALERFSEFQQNSLLGLYHLDLLNVIISIVMIPLYFALFAVHRKTSLPYAAIVLVIAFIGTTVFVSTNTALPMLELSNKYFAAGDETHRTIIAAAGESLIARGEHGSPRVFIGFTLSTLSSILMSFVMLNGKVFKKVVSYFGIIGNISLLPAPQDKDNCRYCNKRIVYALQDITTFSNPDRYS